MGLGAFLGPLRRWWWLLLAATVLAAASGFWHVSRQPRLYTAKTTLMIGRAFEDPNPKGSELAMSQQLAETYADLAQRRPVREQTMAALGLTSLPAYIARPLPNRPLLEISVVDTEPQRAKAVADELANQLVLQSPTSPKPEEQARLAFIGEQLASLQVNIKQTEAKIVTKQAELEQAFGALEISDLEKELGALEAKLSTLQSNYAALLANTKDGANNTLEVIESAALPTAPTASGKAPTVLAASAIALALAAGMAYLLEHFDDTVRTAEALAILGGVDILPGIPELQGGAGSLPVLSSLATRAPALDAFRALRTGLHALTARQSARTLLITSAAPKEGKSMVAANLAAVLAQSEKSVLLVDADLRRPVQHELFGVRGSYGLAELLMAPDGLASANGEAAGLDRAIQSTGQERLGLIVAGSDRTGAAALLGSDRMRALLEALSRRVDYVILDSPPLLAVADALMLSPLADGVVLVARAGSIPRKQLEQTLRRLGSVSARVVGVVLNRAEPAEEGYRYRRAYSGQA